MKNPNAMFMYWHFFSCLLVPFRFPLYLFLTQMMMRKRNTILSTNLASTIFENQCIRSRARSFAEVLSRCLFRSALDSITMCSTPQCFFAQRFAIRLRMITHSPPRSSSFGWWETRDSSTCCPLHRHLRNAGLLLPRAASSSSMNSITPSPNVISIISDFALGKMITLEELERITTNGEPATKLFPGCKP